MYLSGWKHALVSTVTTTPMRSKVWVLEYYCHWLTRRGSGLSPFWLFFFCLTLTCKCFGHCHFGYLIWCRRNGLIVVAAHAGLPKHQVNLLWWFHILFINFLPITSTVMRHFRTISDNCRKPYCNAANCVVNQCRFMTKHVKTPKKPNNLISDLKFRDFNFFVGGENGIIFGEKCIFKNVGNGAEFRRIFQGKKTLSTLYNIQWTVNDNIICCSYLFNQSLNAF